MSNILKIKHKNRIIYLTKERYKHIIEEHPYLSNKLDLIKETIINPLTIKESINDKNVKYYFKYIKSISKYLLVSVKYLNAKGFIITSFYTRKIK